ncbi:MAG: hypothetical protein M0R80_07750 [Proteobacteria bacterium]|jgi:hypothetical protein|nr:hypothetical protein [Pseudomonadota bacterium]
MAKANQIQLWQKMADLTMEKCRQKCKRMGMCCSPEYCDMARDMAKEKGVVIEVTGNETLPFLGADGKCVVPPHLRPLCTLHQCDINGFGFCPEDPEWTEKYFQLREKLREV